MKKTILPLLSLTLLVGITVTFLSCKDDDPAPAYSFKDQDTSGKIDNVAWTYADGYADLTEFNGESVVRVTLTIEQEEGEGCAMGFGEGDRVFFTLPDEVGLYMLAFSADAHTATLLKEDGFVNYIATTGAIEITSITDTQITGKIDARYDGENFVNGNFTVDICQ